MTNHNQKKPMVRRRENDDDWTGASRREPWDGPSSQWGEDVNTRLDSLELKLDSLADSLSEPLRIFQHSKKFGLALVTLVLFFGWNGVVQLWEWVRHLFAAAK